MSVITGNITKAMFKKTSTWDTEVAPAATDAINVKAGSALAYQFQPTFIPESDQPAPKNAAFVEGLVTATAPLMQVARYTDIRLITCALGNGSNYTTPAEQTGGQGDYLHVVTPASDTDGLFGCLSFLKGSLVEVWKGVKITGFTLSGQAGTQDISLQADAVISNRTFASATILSSHFNTMTYPGDQKLLFTDLTVRMNDASGDALDSGDEVCIKGFSFRFTRPMDAALRDNCSGVAVREPVINELTADACTITIDWNYFDSATKELLDDLVAGTRKKIDLTFLGTQIGTGETYQFIVEIPCAIVWDPANSGAYEGSGYLPAQITFNCVSPGNATTNGMTFDSPFRLQVVNTASAKSFAS